ncbi:hypothetical protein GGX14DRAFT_575000 [Mycena pura]|uniref:Uncharacterized protein n=1 Tax=Mycena pura TaxID=153505 RepID=A0AAD6UWZ0_9AGAR|nr:hypothetical protein GGX14DRAFT_575000 [Mycena pura]
MAPLFAAIILVVSGGALAALTPAQVVTNIGNVATVSTRPVVFASYPRQLLPAPSRQSAEFMRYLTVVVDFATIVNALRADVPAMQATPPFDDVAAQPIVDALDNFVQIHQALLATVIGKHSIFSQFGVTAPITAIPRSHEAVIDSFAFAMIDLIPTRSSDVKNDKNQLDTSVGNTISLYEQLCIPSLLYPALLPICIAL